MKLTKNNNNNNNNNKELINENKRDPRIGLGV